MWYLGIGGTSNYDILGKSGFGNFFSIHMQNEMSLTNIKLTVNLVLSFLLSFTPLAFKSRSDLEYQGVSEIEYTWWHFKSNILLRWALYNSAVTGVNKPDSAMKLLEESKMVDFKKI